MTPGVESNLRAGTNPPYTTDDFIALYPQYGPDKDDNYKVPLVILEMYIGLANAHLQAARWRDTWKFAMGLFVAHFATLWLQGATTPDSPAGAVVNAGAARGLLTSKTVGEVPASYDFNAISQDLNGLAAWKLTVYGQQLATFGKLMGMGGMYVR